MTSHTQAWHIMSFEALTSGKSESFGMIDCFVGKTPSVAIAMFRQVGERIEVMPLFIALTPDLDVSYPDRAGDGDSGEEGGPDRETVSRQFGAAKIIMVPSPS
jgi:hypothetical protein